MSVGLVALEALEGFRGGEGAAFLTGQRAAFNASLSLVNANELLDALLLTGAAKNGIPASILKPHGMVPSGSKGLVPLLQVLTRVRSLQATGQENSGRRTRNHGQNRSGLQHNPARRCPSER